MKCIDLSLARKSVGYQILIGADTLDAPFKLFQKHDFSKVAVISNQKISDLYFDVLRRSVQRDKPNCQIELILVGDGEKYKSFHSFNQIIDTLIEKQFKRNDLIIALGGGVIGDLAGFSAASYQRGIDFMQVPTSLLAMVDSSVGGKTAINHEKGKNLIGAFHQPLEVRVDLNCLKTLDKREFNAGMAEIIKIAAVRDLNFYTWLEDNQDSIRNLDRRTLEQMIFRSCQLKSEIVAEDEEEKGVRAILNFGHTFGHGVETLLGYKGILHGEAVSIGMVLASEFSVGKGLLDNASVARLKKLLDGFELPTMLPNAITSKQLVASMKLDKKNRSSDIRLILLKDFGKAVIKDVAPQELESLLKD